MVRSSIKTCPRSDSKCQAWKQGLCSSGKAARGNLGGGKTDSLSKVRLLALVDCSCVPHGSLKDSVTEDCPKYSFFFTAL